MPLHSPPPYRPYRIVAGSAPSGFFTLHLPMSPSQTLWPQTHAEVRLSVKEWGESVMFTWSASHTDQNDLFPSAGFNDLETQLAWLQLSQSWRSEACSLDWVQGQGKACVDKCSRLIGQFPSLTCQLNGAIAWSRILNKETERYVRCDHHIKIPWLSNSNSGLTMSHLSVVLISTKAASFYVTVKPGPIQICQHIPQALIKVVILVPNWWISKQLENRAWPKQIMIRSEGKTVGPQKKGYEKM